MVHGAALQRKNEPKHQPDDDRNSYNTPQDDSMGPCYRETKQC